MPCIRHRYARDGSMDSSRWRKGEARGSIALRASGLYRLNKDQIAERGARLARRDDREYREYLREEQRSQPRGPRRGTRAGVEEGCPAREVVLDQPIQATSSLFKTSPFEESSMDVFRRLMGVGLVVLSVVCPNVDASAVSVLNPR